MKIKDLFSWQDQPSQIQAASAYLQPRNIIFSNLNIYSVAA